MLSITRQVGLSLRKKVCAKEKPQELLLHEFARVKSVVSLRRYLYRVDDYFSYRHDDQMKHQLLILNYTLMRQHVSQLSIYILRNYSRLEEYCIRREEITAINIFFFEIIKHLILNKLRKTVGNSLARSVITISTV